MNETLNRNFLIELGDFPGYFVGVDGVYSEKYGYMRKLKGSVGVSGYHNIGLCEDGKETKKRVHRLIAQMFIPNPNNFPQVDHINHNRQDNRIENLRWVTQSDNMRNSSISKNNTSGEQGVCFNKKDNSWVADFRDNQGKRKSKFFSIKKYGDNAKQLAIEYRKKIVDELYNRP